MFRVQITRFFKSICLLFDMTTKNTLLQIIIAFFSLGSLLNLVGVITFQASIGAGNAGFIWYYAFYYVACAILYVALTFKALLEQYRLAIVGFASVGFVYCTLDLSLSISTAQFATNGLLAGMVLKAIGLFLIVFPYILIILITGSENESFVGKRFTSGIAGSQDTTTQRVERKPSAVA